MKSHTALGENVVACPPTDGDLIEKLKEASFYQTYQNAFRSVTGLPLVLVAADSPGFNACHASENQNPFCRTINLGESPCSACVLAQKCALQAAVRRAHSTECFAGMKETAVPLRLGERIVGYLKTGQIFTRKPGRTVIDEAKVALAESGRSEDEIAELIKLLKRTPVVAPEKYAGMITILSAFALQLSALMNRILLECRTVEPEPVRKAKEFIMSRIDDRLSLEEVAAAVNVSTYYFCKIFKQSTGMTYTEYVNRQRIELAKRELLKPDRRVTEVAYDVGYQSLSQFNRSFLKIVGESPTRFRKRMKTGDSAVLVA